MEKYKQQLKNLTSTFLLLMAVITASAQKEFLINVEPSTGTYNLINHLPGVNYIVVGPSYTTYDKNHHRYIFNGIDTSGINYLYSVNAITGNIISKPLFPVLQTPGDNIIELQYDNSTDMLYGLHWDYNLKSEFLVTIDPYSGAYTKIDSLNAVKYIAVDPGYTTFDENHHLYIFHGIDSSFNYFLYSVDVITGDIVSQVSYPVGTDQGDRLCELKFDNSAGIMYGLFWDYSENRQYLATVDPTTGTFSIIDSIPGVKWISTSPNYTTFDEINHRYIFRGGDMSGNAYLYSIDISNGAIISNPVFPVLPSPTSNIIELEFDNSNEELYALHWNPRPIIITGVENNILNNSFTIKPNPFKDNLTIKLNNEYKEVIVFIYNSSGSMVRKECHYSSKTINIKRDLLPDGLYYISLICDRINIGGEKIIAE
jgi:hypothetical protein